MNNIETMKLALEALEGFIPYLPLNDKEQCARYDQAITALRQAIEQAQQAEPCGLECDCTDVCKQDNYKALWEQMCERCDELDKQLAQRTWVGLTEAQCGVLWKTNMTPFEYYEAIEAKLKEKNT